MLELHSICERSEVDIRLRIILLSFFISCPPHLSVFGPGYRPPADLYTFFQNRHLREVNPLPQEKKKSKKKK